MRRILKAIISRNIVTIGRDELITEILWRLIGKSHDISTADVVQDGNKKYIKLQSIPDSLLRDLGFNRPSFYHHPKPELGESPPDGSPVDYRRIEERFAESDIATALTQVKANRHEFIDYFIDEETIKRKALTLALLKNIGPNVRDVPYLKSVYVQLIEKKVSSDLPLKSFRDFYKKLKWYCKVGWSSGCLEETK